MKKNYTLFAMLRRHFGAIRKSNVWVPMMLDGVLALIMTAASLSTVFLFQWLFDSAAGLLNGTRSLSYLFMVLLILIAAQCFSSYSNSAFNIYGRNMIQNAERFFSCSIHEKAARIDPVDFEKPEMLDMVTKAKAGVGHSTSLVFIAVLAATHYFPYYIGMAIYLFLLDPVLALALPLSAIPPIVSLLFRLFYFDKIADETAPHRRKYEYYETAIIDRNNFKETRTLGAFHFLNRKYQDSIHEFGRVYVKQEGKSLRVDLALKILEIVVYLCIVALAVSSLLRGNITVGAFAAVFSSIHSLMGNVQGLLRWHFGNVATNFSAIKSYFTFLDLPERTGTKPLPATGGGIVLDDVSFTYPEAEKPSLSHVSLTIRDGETVAVVGRNGAGKSTLVRLLSGLYLPDKGSVKLFGTETADIDLKEIHKRTSAVFQDYLRYRYPLNLNVSISDTSHEPAPGAVEKALKQADLPLPQPCFPKGEETMLSREFGGVDLSGGQWQRVAIARGLYRPHDLLFLDEPTAAIDPLEEKALYEKFMELAAGHTAVLVTHRLGSAKLADRILVMDEGRLSAAGTHKELMQSCPLYKSMYESQAGWYT